MNLPDLIGPVSPKRTLHSLACMFSVEFVIFEAKLVFQRIIVQAFYMYILYA